MTKQMWIDNTDASLKLGSRGFLVRNHHETKGWTRYQLRSNPPKTNQSFEDRPYGWCGTYDNIDTHGEGAWEVIRVAVNGRVQIQEIDTTDKLAAFLDEFGYPELLSEMLDDLGISQ